MLHVTIVGDLRKAPLQDELRRRGCIVDEVHYNALLGPIRLQESISDVVICFPLADHHYRSGYLTYSKAKSVKKQLGSLANDVCMPDGRKWSAIPFLMLFDERRPDPILIDLQGGSEDVLSYFDDAEAFRLVEVSATQYKQQLLSGFDNLGFLVSYENGRLRIGPALGGKKHLENDFYNGNADRSRSSTSGLVTVHRDLLGVEFEVEQLEFLLNKKDLKENELQRFFVDNPHFLAVHRQGTPLPHLRFSDADGRVLIPDFVVQPSSGLSRGSNWEVLDLKLPTEKLLAGKGNRTRFTASVIDAVVQLQDYSRFFNDPRNEDAVKMVLKRHLKYPKLAVLIGRMPQAAGDIEALELAQSRDPLVKIITYDEILESQRQLLN